ncbi:MAG: hypothetical protein DMF96_01075, partial [Acidobacteria bacterium]
PDYLARLKQRIAGSGLKANMGALRSRHDIPLDDSIREVRKQIENAGTLALTSLLTFGVDKPEEYEHYYKVMSDAAAYAQERRIKVVMKPHGGSSGASDAIVAVMKAVRHPNFKIWYDAGNIIYYTGKDPIEELKPIARHVTGFCAKDCGGVKDDDGGRDHGERARESRVPRNDPGAAVKMSGLILRCRLATGRAFTATPRDRSPRTS